MYAIVDNADIVIGFEYRDLPLSDLVNKDMYKNYILTDEEGLKVDDIYHRDTNTFERVPQPEPEPVVPPEPTEQEIIQAEIMLAQVEILEKQKEQDCVLAEILLNQMGV